jgi:hypothetical protein
MSAEPLDLAYVKRNGYPCDSRTFWGLVATVEALTARLDVARAAYLAGDWDALEAQLYIRDLSKGATSMSVDDLRRAATADPTPQTDSDQ